MKDSAMANYTISQDDGTGKGGSTPPLSAMPSVVAPGDPVKSKVYTSRYYFSKEEAEEMLSALVDEMNFLLDLHPYEVEDPIVEEAFLLPPASDSDSLSDEWLPF